MKNCWVLLYAWLVGAGSLTGCLTGCQKQIVEGKQTSPAMDSTGIGNGGDIATAFLEATRSSLVKTLKTIQAKTPGSVCECKKELGSNSSRWMCDLLNNLNSEERQYCENFIKANTAGFLHLIDGDQPVRFLIAGNDSKIFSLSTPEKTPCRLADAVTQTDATSAIFFKQSTVQHLSSEEILFLFAHELGHKVEFPSVGEFIHDQQSIGPFKDAAGGKKLLDSAAAAITVFALETGKIGSPFLLSDHFLCGIQIAGQGDTFYSSGGSLRNFQGSNLKAYEIGIGLSPNDFHCELEENWGKSKLSLRLKIHEETSCEISSPGKRRVDWELWRESLSSGPTASLIESGTRLDWNPLCAQNRNPLLIHYQNQGREIIFSIQYQFSQGTVADFREKNPAFKNADQIPVP